eukprot:9477836-Pyramimonas_sp.AAC.2
MEEGALLIPPLFPIPHPCHTRRAVAPSACDWQPLSPQGPTPAGARWDDRRRLPLNGGDGLMQAAARGGRLSSCHSSPCSSI